jgi:hypothetical protein
MLLRVLAAKCTINPICSGTAEHEQQQGGKKLVMTEHQC